MQADSAEGSALIMPQSCLLEGKYITVHALGLWWITF